MMFQVGNEISRMYEARRARRAAQKCGLGGGSCCASCERGGECEGLSISQAKKFEIGAAGADEAAHDHDHIEVHQTLLDAGTQEGAKELLEMARSGVGKKVGGGSGDFMLDAIRRGVGEADELIEEDPADGLGALRSPGGRWMHYANPAPQILQALHLAPKASPGGTMPPGSYWQQVEYQSTWYGLYTPPRAAGGAGTTAPPRAYYWATTGLGLGLECGQGEAWDPYAQKCIRTTFSTVIPPFGVGAFPAGLGVAGDQIASAIQLAQQAANQAVPAYGTAVGYCSAATTAAVTAEQTLASQPSMPVIGAADATTTKLVANGYSTASDYNVALAAAQAAQTAFLNDAATQPTPQPQPAPQPVPTPTPPSPTPTPSPTPGPAPAPASASGSSYATPIIVGAAVVGASIIGYALYRRRGGKALTLSSGSRAKTRHLSTARTARA